MLKETHFCEENLFQYDWRWLVLCIVLQIRLVDEYQKLFYLRYLMFINHKSQQDGRGSLVKTQINEMIYIYIHSQNIF